MAMSREKGISMLWKCCPIELIPKMQITLKLGTASLFPALKVEVNAEAYIHCTVFSKQTSFWQVMMAE